MKIPNTKIVSLISVTAIILIAVISYNEYKDVDGGDKFVQKTNSNAVQIVLENNHSVGDTDSDGLFDWEENLWGTDIKKKDTDGDGTSDGEEVVLGRDPKVKGPNDKYKEEIDFLDNFTVDYKVSNSDSLTSRVARELLVSANKKEGENGAVSISSKIKSELAIADAYKKENIITFDPENIKKMEKYSSSLMKILSEEIAAAQKNESYKYVYSDAYKNMGLRLSTLEVPSNLLTIHTSYINNYNALSIIERRMVDSEKDPVIVLATMPEYSRLINEQNILFEQIRLYYKNNDIIFINSNETN